MSSNPNPGVEDIRTVTIECPSGVPTDLGSRVADGHMRHIIALKHSLVSGAGSSGIQVGVYDTWGTSAMPGGISNNPVDYQMLVSGQTVQWPTGPRPDMPIGHVKSSGIAGVMSSGGIVFTTMVYFDKPGGTF